MDKVLSAISEMNCKKIDELLKAGADVNMRIGLNEDTLLHCSYTLNITKLLLFYGANVNDRNRNFETPLHCAIIEQKGLPIVQIILKYGPEINAVDNEGKTALHHSVDYRRNTEERICVWKELLDHGADLGMRCLEFHPFDHYCTPLCKAIESEDKICAKYFLKMCLIKNLMKDFTKYIDFNSYVSISSNNPSFVRELSNYQDNCISELSLIKSYKMNFRYSLYDFIAMRKDKIVKPLYFNNNNYISEDDVMKSFPIYGDVILPSLTLSIQRAELLDQLKTFRLFLQMDNPDETINEGVVLLTTDCLMLVADYLNNDDLANFISSFC